MSQTIVIALGGNALGENLAEQMAAVKSTSRSIVDLIEQGHRVVITHGNGPQVGMIDTAFEAAAMTEAHTPHLPMSVCVALSQGYILSLIHIWQGAREARSGPHATSVQHRPAPRISSALRVGPG